VPPLILAPGAADVETLMMETGGFAINFVMHLRGGYDPVHPAVHELTASALLPRAQTAANRAIRLEYGHVDSEIRRSAFVRPARPISVETPNSRFPSVRLLRPRRQWRAPNTTRRCAQLRQSSPSPLLGVGTMEAKMTVLFKVEVRPDSSSKRLTSLIRGRSSYR
jgi:hypothetical protein